jgi:hypothetical protein
MGKYASNRYKFLREQKYNNLKNNLVLMFIKNCYFIWHEICYSNKFLYNSRKMRDLSLFLFLLFLINNLKLSDNYMYQPL